MPWWGAPYTGWAVWLPLVKWENWIQTLKVTCPRILTWFWQSQSPSLFQYPDLSMHAQSLQSCLTLWDPTDYSPPGFSVHGMLQARILDWVAMPSSRGSFQPRDLPDPGIKPVFPTSSALQADSLSTEPPGKPLSRSTCNYGHMGRLSRRDQQNDEWRKARHSSWQRGLWGPLYPRVNAGNLLLDFFPLQ